MNDTEREGDLLLARLLRDRARLVSRGGAAPPHATWRGRRAGRKLTMAASSPPHPFLSARAAFEASAGHFDATGVASGPGVGDLLTEASGEKSGR